LGLEFVLVAMRPTWGEDRMFLLDEEGTQCSLLRAWTDVADLDLFVALAGGPSALRVVDLLALAELVEEMRA
jgi:hypothetical protein